MIKQKHILQDLFDGYGSYGGSIKVKNISIDIKKPELIPSLLEQLKEIKKRDLTNINKVNSTQQKK